MTWTGYEKTQKRAIKCSRWQKFVRKMRWFFIRRKWDKAEAFCYRHLTK